MKGAVNSKVLHLRTSRSLVAYQKKTGIDCLFYNFMRDTVREINQIDSICLNNYGQTTPIMGMPIDRRG